MTQDTRPLSPHLQVYRRTFAMLLSITHRITGSALSVGLVALAAWLTALAAGPAAYGDWLALATSLPGRVVLGGLVVAFCYHLAAGVRHLVFDTGRGLERADARRSGILVAVATLVLSAFALWALFAAGAAP
jgi:succinate dehydrogenase / fumarate reductase cytochrome b subunit